MIERYISQGRARQIFDEMHVDVREDRPDEDLGFGEPTVWSILRTGYLPVWISEGRVSIPWDVVLEHGRCYIQHIQEFEPRFEGDNIEDRRKEAISLVGGSMPW